MPLTLPAHAAAALPFAPLTKRWLHAHALVVGCCAPDIAYLFGADRELSHGFRLGLLTGIVVGVLAYAWCEWLAFPVWRRCVPAAGWLDIRRMLAPSVPTTSGGWLTVIAGLAIGTLTHLLWDGVTHAGWWPGVLLFPAARSLGWLWLLSTVAGSLAVMAFLYRRYFTPKLLDLTRTGLIGLASTIIATAAAYVVGRILLPTDAVVPDWNAKIWALRVGFLAFTAFCFVRSRA